MRDFSDKELNLEEQKHPINLHHPILSRMRPGGMAHGHRAPVRGPGQKWMAAIAYFLLAVAALPSSSIHSARDSHTWCKES